MKYYRNSDSTYFELAPDGSVRYRALGSPIVDGGYDGNPDIVADDIASGAWVPVTGISNFDTAVWVNGQLIDPS